jgi:hypothetical protein
LGGNLVKPYYEYCAVLTAGAMQFSRG